MLRGGVLCDVKDLRNRSFGDGKKGPLGAHGSAKLLESVVVIGGDRGDLGVCHSDLRIKRGKIQMLLVLFGAVVAARKCQDQGIIALEFAEPARCACVIGQLIVGNNRSAYEVNSHDWIPFTTANEVWIG